MKENNFDFSENIDVDGIFGESFDSMTAKGIKSSSKAFRGPLTVQIDLTNTCNLDCVACWCYSEMMDELKFTPEISRIKLEKKKAIELVHELNDLGVSHIFLSGGGDPSTHPNFMGVVKEIKLLKIKLTIVTNFTLWTKQMIEKAVEYEVDNLNISMWAASPETYVKIHPNQTEKTYHKLIESMKYLQQIKNGKGKPLLKYFNVISAYNYFEIEKMLEVALCLGADFVEYQIVDIVQGKTEELRLTDEMVESIQKQFENLKKHERYFDEFCVHDMPFDYIRPENISFGKFVKELRPGFKFDRNALKLRCPKGFLSKERNRDTENTSSFNFRFSEKICERCELKRNCFKEKNHINVEFLSLLGHGAFTRRMNSKTKGLGLYDMEIVDKIPCYVGWTYSRILPNGDVIPCCKGHRMPIGNIHRNKLKDIWYSETYNKFRHMAKTKSKKDKFFSRISCLKCCDNLGMNIETHAKMELIKK